MKTNGKPPLLAVMQGGELQLSCNQFTPPLARARRGSLNGFENPCVASATALVTGKRLAQVFCFIGVFEIVGCGDDHSGRADSALRPTFLVEGLLKRVKFAISSEAFDRRQVLSLSLANRNHAGQNQHSIHDRGACAALSLATSLLRPGQSEIFPKHIEQPLHWRRGHVIVLSIDRERSLRHGNSTSPMIRWVSKGISLMNCPPSA